MSQDLDPGLASSPNEPSFFLCRLLPPRPSFALDMTPDERDVMMAHVGYWTELLGKGKAIVFGPVADPAGPWGLGVIRVTDDSEMRQLTANDPAILRNIGLRYEVLPMLRAVVAKEPPSNV